MPEEPKTSPQEEKHKRHQKFLNMVRQWAEGTDVLRQLMRRDYDFVNGRQTDKTVQKKVTETGRELLYFNEIRPQYELLSGYRTSHSLDYIPAPRGREDKRLSTVASAVLKATFDVGKKNQVTRRVGDDGDACGLGAIEIFHSFDYADDVVWGDIGFERISPFSFVWDIWGTSPHYQDGMYMGKSWWMAEDKYRDTYGKNVTIPSADTDWMSIISTQINDLSDAFRRELLNAEKKHVRVFRLHYKVPVDLYMVCDGETGDVYDGGSSEESAKEKQKEVLLETAKSRLGKLEITSYADEVQAGFVIVDENGNPMVDPETQQLLLFASQENAQAWIDGKIEELKSLIGENWKIIKRKRMRIKWAEFSAYDLLDEGELSETAQMYPYRVYISRHIGDDIEDIEGIVRQVIDRQKEITKRYNHLADHLAHSAFSGWFNKKGDGADSRKLQLLGARPGVVVEYATVRPEQITPNQIPAGHFTLLDANVAGMQRGTGMNAELLGFTSTSTVSGDAIEARQKGGVTMQLSRLTNYQDFEKEVAEQTLYQIQVSMPVEKMRRILGVWEAQHQQQILGTSVFLDPVTAQPITESQLLHLLSTMKFTKFDLTLKPTPVDQSTRERQFMQALQATQLVLQTGRPMGQVTFEQLLHMSDLPEMFVAALVADSQQAMQQALAQQQLAQMGEVIKQQQARRGPNA